MIVRHEMQSGRSKLGLLLWIVGLLLVLAVALLWFFPASVAVGWASSRMQPLVLEGVSGSLWNGRSEQASVYGRPLGELRWQASPLSLIGGSQRAQMQLSGGELSAELDMTPQGTREIRLYPSYVGLPAERIGPLLDTPALRYSGDIDIAIEDGVIGTALPRNMKGTAIWRNAAVSGAAQAVLGDLEAQFESPAAGGLRGRLLDHGGPLQLEGEFHLDYSGYGAQATLRARDGNPAVLEALRFIGQPQPDGSSRFELQGSLLGLSK